MTSGPSAPRLKIPWWLILLLVLFAARFWNSFSRNAFSSNANAIPMPSASGAFTTQVSVQGSEVETDNACQKAIDVSNGSETRAMFLAHASETVKVCTTAYEDGLKDAAQDSGDAHYLDENNAATEEEMVAATLGIEGDTAGSKEATDKAVALARDVEEHSNNPKLAAASKETIRELVGPISFSDRQKYLKGWSTTNKANGKKK